MTPVLSAGVLAASRKPIAVPGPCRTATGAARRPPPAAGSSARGGCGAVGAGPCAGGWVGSRHPERPPGSALRSGPAALRHRRSGAPGCAGTVPAMFSCRTARPPAMASHLLARAGPRQGLPLASCEPRVPAASPYALELHCGWPAVVIANLPAGVSLRVSCRFALACVRAPTVTYPSLCAPGVTRLYAVLAHAPVCLCGFIGAYK